MFATSCARSSALPKLEARLPAHVRPRAMPAPVVAGNLPGFDRFVALALGSDPLAVHRGFTH